MKPGAGQVYSNGCWAWRVERLIELAAELPVEEVPITALRDLDEPSWGSALTVLEAVEHLRRVKDADLRYPILLSEDGWIMDGCHRVAKAIWRAARRSGRSGSRRTRPRTSTSGSDLDRAPIRLRR